ncbi:MAG: response regulator [Planctomycetes bacterium]|nr:response regulator [Planctomycetota bacterium]
MTRNPLGTILVVEDEAELRFILLAHLRAAGFDVLEATDGATAVRLTQERVPDLILMDVGLPMLDGVAATKALKADPATTHIPIIMLTGRARTEDVVRGLEAGAQEYLVKPFAVAELLARVRTVHQLAAAHKDLDRLNTKLEAEVDIKTRRLQLLYEFMRDLNQAHTHQRIYDLIMQCVERMTGARRLSLLLLDPSGEHLACVRAVGIDPKVAEQIRVGTAAGIAGQVFQTGTTLAARALGGAAARGEYRNHSFVSTPLFSASLATRDGIIGVLNVTEKDENAAFSQEEIECIRSIADAAAIALDNITRRTQLQQSVRVLLQTVGQLAEYRDEETTLHIARVSRMARILANQLHREGPYAALVTEEFIDNLVQAAPMHDIGKVGIPDEILTKPGKLTDEEYNIMKTHTDIGRRVLSQALDPAHPVPLLQMCVDIAYCHHERYDGRGYPRRIAGEAIPLSARIIALVDAYDAITSRRRYSKARTHEQAVAIVREEAGKHFDPVLVQAFLACQDQFDDIRARYDETQQEPATPVGRT